MWSLTGKSCWPIESQIIECSPKTFDFMGRQPLLVKDHVVPIRTVLSCKINCQKFGESERLHDLSKLKNLQSFIVRIRYLSWKELYIVDQSEENIGAGILFRDCRLINIIGQKRIRRWLCQKLEITPYQTNTGF